MAKIPSLSRNGSGSQDQDPDYYYLESRAGADFVYINEKPVDDVSLNLFYQPRTLTLLCIVILALLHVAFNR